MPVIRRQDDRNGFTSKSSSREKLMFSRAPGYLLSLVYRSNQVYMYCVNYRKIHSTCIFPLYFQLFLVSFTLFDYQEIFQTFKGTKSWSIVKKLRENVVYKLIITVSYVGSKYVMQIRNEYVQGQNGITIFIFQVFQSLREC